MSDLNLLFLAVVIIFAVNINGCLHDMNREYFESKGVKYE